MTVQRIHCPNGGCVVETKDDTGRIIDLTSFDDRDGAWAAIGLLLNVLISMGHNPVTILPDKEAHHETGD